MTSDKLKMAIPATILKPFSQYLDNGLSYGKQGDIEVPEGAYLYY